MDGTDLPDHLRDFIESHICPRRRAAPAVRVELAGRAALR
jgi:hypothetical protein